MYIHRIIMKDVPGSPDRDLTLWNEWKDEPLKSVLFTGMNGTGKTRTLRLIAALWASFADMLLAPQSSILQDNKTLQDMIDEDFIRDSELVAVEIRDLISRPLILYLDNYSPDSSPIRQYISGDALAVQVTPRTLVSHTQYGIFQGILPEDIELENLATQIRRSQLGGIEKSNLPNIVFMDAEFRQVSEIPNQQLVYRTQPPEPLYSWLAVYNQEAYNTSTGIPNLSFVQMLRNLKIRDPKWFYQTLGDINTFFIGKKLTDFDDRLNLMVELESGKKHNFYDLSSGERQCLLLMFMVSRWMMPGGAVLIDEPDLHLHVSLQRQFIRALERLVLEKQGQLIITSHSPTVWEEYDRRQHITFNFEEQHG